MAITSIEQSRNGNVTTVVATSGLAGDVRFYWYLDAAFVASTVSGTKSFVLERDDQARVDVLDSIDPAFDPVANAPVGYPARRSVSWVRSLDDDVGSYRVDQRQDGGSWTAIGSVPHEANRWSYSVLSPRLVDLDGYEWRVVPVDLSGNDGTALSLGSAVVVRTPDAPRFTVSFDDATARVTFTEVA